MAGTLTTCAPILWQDSKILQHYKLLLKWSVAKNEICQVLLNVKFQRERLPRHLQKNAAVLFINLNLYKN